MLRSLEKIEQEQRPDGLQDVAEDRESENEWCGSCSVCGRTCPQVSPRSAGQEAGFG